jgi:hypothetical protein
LPSGLTPIPNVSSDAEYLRDATLVDHIQEVASEDVRADRQLPEKDEHALASILRREAITARAKAEAAAENSSLPRPLSKKTQRSDLRANRSEEIAAIAAGAAEASMPEKSKEGVNAIQPCAAAAEAMQNFMAEVCG